MLTRQFTDVYGVTHAAAVFQVDNINVNNHSHRRIFIDDAAPLKPFKEDEATVYSVEFSARFWASQQTKSDGKLHMQFSIIDSQAGFEQGVFTVEFEENPITLAQATVIEKVEAKLLELITQGQG